MMMKLFHPSSSSCRLCKPNSSKVFVSVCFTGQILLLVLLLPVLLLLGNDACTTYFVHGFVSTTTTTFSTKTQCAHNHHKNPLLFVPFLKQPPPMNSQCETSWIRSSSPSSLLSLSSLSQSPRKKNYHHRGGRMMQVVANNNNNNNNLSSSKMTQLFQSSVSWGSSSSSQQQDRSSNVIVRLIQNLKQRIGSINEVHKWRFVFGSILTVILSYRSVLDEQFIHFWNFLMTSSALPARIFRSDSYEWSLAVMVFAVCMHGFGYVDKVVQKAVTEKGNVNHPWRKYRLQDRYEADIIYRQLTTTTTTSQQQKQKQENELQQTDSTELSFQSNNNNNNNNPMSDSSTNTDVVVPPSKQSPWHYHGWWRESLIYIVPLLTWDIVAPRRHRRLAPFGPPTTLKIISHVTIGLLLYDMFFFIGHYAMHKIPIIYKRVHRRHHMVKEARACEAVRLSIPEEVYDVACSIIALNLMGAHPVARSIYNCVIVFLLCELHCGYDFPWTPQNIIPFGLATGSRRHHYHHRFGKHYYQKFFFTLDRLFGFFQKNDGTLMGSSVQPNPYLPPAWK